MYTTSSRLLRRVRDNDDTSAWHEFYQLYSGLIVSYARASGLDNADAMDVLGESMATLSREMGRFEYDRDHCKFRSYLRTIVNKKIVDMVRKKARPEVPATYAATMEGREESPDELWDRQWELNRLRWCWKQVEQGLSQMYADAFRLFAIEGMPAKKVASALGITVNHVYQIKARVTKRLKEAMVSFVGDE